MRIHQSTRRIPASSEMIAELLCDSSRLPEWNPALVDVDASGPAVANDRYPVRAIRGLRGHLVYTLIGPERIEMTMELQGLREESYWALEADGDQTDVEHGFTHSGFLGRILAPAFENVAELRLDRLATRAVG